MVYLSICLMTDEHSVDKFISYIKFPVYIFHISLANLCVEE